MTRDLKNWLKKSILAIAIPILLVPSAPANAYEKSFDLTDTSVKVFFLGDVLKIDTGWCLPTKKLPKTLSSARLEIYQMGKWIKVGSVTFVKSDRCQKKTPYLSQYRWEIDNLGALNPDSISGNLRLRNTAIKPTLYSKVHIYESESAYKEAERKEIEEKKLRAGEMLLCLIKGGEWNSAGDYCVLPPG